MPSVLYLSFDLRIGNAAAPIFLSSKLGELVVDVDLLVLAVRVIVLELYDLEDHGPCPPFRAFPSAWWTCCALQSMDVPSLPPTVIVGKFGTSMLCRAEQIHHALNKPEAGKTRAVFFEIVQFFHDLPYGHDQQSNVDNELAKLRG